MFDIRLPAPDLELRRLTETASARSPPLSPRTLSRIHPRRRIPTFVRTEPRISDPPGVLASGATGPERGRPSSASSATGAPWLPRTGSRRFRSAENSRLIVVSRGAVRGRAWATDAGGGCWRFVRSTRCRVRHHLGIDDNHAYMGICARSATSTTGSPPTGAEVAAEMTSAPHPAAVVDLWMGGQIAVAGINKYVTFFGLG